MKLASTLLALSLLLPSLTPAARAQCDPQWLRGGTSAGVTAASGTPQVRVTTTWDPDGPGPQTPVVIAAGVFTHAGGIPATNIAAWDPATGDWSPLGGGMPGQINALAVLPTGELVAAGQAGVRRWNGAAWSLVGTSISEVEALAVLPGGDLIAAGAFTLSGGRNRIVRLGGSSWQALGTGTDGTISSLTVLPNGDLVAGGGFSSAGGVPAHRIARWDGETWSPLGTPSVSYISSLITLPTGEIVAGGDRVVLWDNEAWTIIGQPSAFQVSELTLLPSGDLVACGSFAAMNGVPATGVARWDGETWFPLGTGTQGPTTGHAFALTTLPDGSVVMGGQFTHAGRALVNRVARWDGEAWAALSSGPNDRITALLPLPDGTTLVTGAFTSVGGVPARNVAIWDGAHWSALGRGLDITFGDSIVNAAALMPNGDIVVGGNFSLAGGAPASYIARWDGESWSSLGTGTSGPVNALATLPDGTLVAGGRFSSAGGVNCRNIARWDGAVWSPLAGGIVGEVSASVNALLVLPDGDLIAGAAVVGAGLYGHNVRRWDGTAWTILPPLGQNSSSAVHALALLPGGDLVAAGFFTTPAPSLNNIARWDGQAWAPLGAGVGGQVSALLALPGGDLIAGGTFTTADGAAANRVARWDGAAWSPLGDGLSGFFGPPFNTNAAALALHPSGEVLVGGNFLQAGGLISAGLARWTDTSEPWIAAHPQPQDVRPAHAATFTVTPARGYDSLSFAWTHNGLPLTDGVNASGSIIAGAATPSLTISNAGPSDQGDYAVTVANACGQATSAPAPLIVTPNPCPADWSGDGVVNSGDISAFLTTWIDTVLSPVLTADFNNDGVVNSGDISAFLTAWISAVGGGC